MDLDQYGITFIHHWHGTHHNHIMNADCFEHFFLMLPKYSLLVTDSTGILYDESSRSRRHHIGPIFDSALDMAFGCYLGNDPATPDRTPTRKTCINGGAELGVVSYEIMTFIAECFGIMVEGIPATEWVRRKHGPDSFGQEYRQFPMYYLSDEDQQHNPHLAAALVPGTITNQHWNAGFCYCTTHQILALFGVLA